MEDREAGYREAVGSPEADVEGMSPFGCREEACRQGHYLVREVLASS